MIQIIPSDNNENMGTAPRRVYKWLRSHGILYVSYLNNINEQEYFITGLYADHKTVETFQNYLKKYPFNPKGRFAFEYIE